MNLKLWELGDKYVETAKQVDQLLRSTDLPYSIGIVVVPLPPKFKVL